MQCDPNYWVVAAQFGTPVVLGLIGFFFTRRQIELSRDKLRLDHFDKRFAVFEAARTFLGKATIQGAITPADDNEFLLGTRGATFIFKDQRVKAYLDELRRRMIALSVGKDALAKNHDPFREQRMAKYLADREWIEQQYNEIEAVFRPQLQLNA